MNRRTFSLSLISIGLAAPVAAFGQKSQKKCEPDGTPHRHFLVYAGRSGTFYDESGPAFPMLIKLDGERIQVDAVGIYAVGGKPIFGAVPAEVCREFMKEPRAASDVMLRLEITASQYERGLNVLRTWEKRIKEDTLLYLDPALNNILLLKQVTESLDQCGEKNVKLYKLDWGVDDKVSEEIPPPMIPFLFFKEMRRLNRTFHVRDEKFQEYKDAAAKSARN